MQSQVRYLADPNQTQVIFQKLWPKLSLYSNVLFLMKLEIDEISIYKSELMWLLSLAISEQFKRVAELRVLFTVLFVTISAQTVSQNALTFAVFTKILLKVFSGCAILWSETCVKPALSV